MQCWALPGTFVRVTSHGGHKIRQFSKLEQLKQVPQERFCIMVPEFSRLRLHTILRRIVTRVLWLFVRIPLQLYIH